MLISKNYLKRIIKEEIQKLNEEEQLKQKTIIITPQQFLDLTTNAEIMDQLKKRFENLTYDPFTIAKETPNLVLDQNGKVINHEGRLRAYVLNKNKENTYEVKLYYPAKLDIEKQNLMLFNQFDDEKSITLNKDEKSKQIDITELSSINNVDQARLSGIFREIVSNLIKQNNTSKEDAVETLNKQLQKYNVILEPPREEDFSITCTIRPMISARIYKKNFNPDSKLNNPESNLFQNPISWKDKISLRKK